MTYCILMGSVLYAWVVLRQMANERERGMQGLRVKVEAERRAAGEKKR